VNALRAGGLTLGGIVVCVGSRSLVGSRASPVWAFVVAMAVTCVALGYRPLVGWARQGVGRLATGARRLVTGERGLIGPYGPALGGVALVMVVLGLASGVAVIQGVIRDQATYASVINTAAQAAARDVSAQEIAGGEVIVNTTKATGTFDAYLTDPTAGALTSSGASVYLPADQTAETTGAPTVTKATIESPTVSAGSVSVTGTITDAFDVPVIGKVTETLPEDTTVTGVVQLANKE